eukprot:7316068-Prymnesium_polylepis.1
MAIEGGRRRSKVIEGDQGQSRAIKDQGQSRTVKSNRIRGELLSCVASFSRRWSSSSSRALS